MSLQVICWECTSGTTPKGSIDPSILEGHGLRNPIPPSNDSCVPTGTSIYTPLQWRHNGRNCDCLLNRLFRRRSTKTSKLRVTGLFAGNSPGPVTSEFPTQMASNAKNVSIWWRHHDKQHGTLPNEYWQYRRGYPQRLETEWRIYASAK